MDEMTSPRFEEDAEVQTKITSTKFASNIFLNCVLERRHRMGETRRKIYLFLSNGLWRFMTKAKYHNEIIIPGKAGKTSWREGPSTLLIAFSDIGA